MTYVIKCKGIAARQGPNPQAGPVDQFLKKYEVRSGLSDWTFDVDEAVHFKDMASAIQMWRSVLPSEPIRADGKANRPLTAFSVEFLTLEDARAEQKKQ